MADANLDIVPAEGINRVENCVVIKREEGDEIPTLIEIVSAAVKNNAHVNSDDEAGDDLYAVQFPGQPQELLAQDDIAARIRNLFA